MNPIYKFTLSNGTQPYECHPIYGNDLAKEFSIPTGEWFFRASLNGKITFNASDFTYIADSPFDAEFTFDVSISYDGGQTWTPYWEGVFWKTDCEFDYDDGKVTVTPQSNDRYKSVLDGMEKEYDLIQLAPEVEVIRVDKRPLIQIYVEGETTIGCFLSGMWWEQECKEVTEQSTLINTYHFAKGATKKEVKVSGVLAPDVSGYYAGDFTSAANNYECLFKTGSYVFRYRYSVHSGYVRGDWEIVRTSDNVVLWSYYAQGQNPDLNPTQITMTPVSGTGASGTVTAELRDINTYGRIILDLSEKSGVTIYPLPTEDITDNNRNYHYVLPYSSYEVKATPHMTEIPTKWGIFQPGQYYEEPLDASYFPIGRSSWGGVSVWLKEGYLANEADYRSYFLLRDTYRLSSVIEVLLDKIAPNITHRPTTDYSQFLYGENPITNISQTLFITPKSNVVTAGYDQPAQKAPITLRQITDMLRDCFRCYWWIDEQGRFRIEHVEYFRRGGSYYASMGVGLNLTTNLMSRNGKPWAYVRNKFTFDKPEMASRYQFGWMDDVTELFEGYPIDILSKYVRQDYIESVNVSMFTSDIDYILLNPTAISQDGFVLMSAVLSYLSGYVLPYWTADGHELQNGYVAFAYLQQYYLYDLPARNYAINGERKTAVGVKKLMNQQVTFPAPQDINLQQLIKTDLGNGMIAKLSINLSSRKASATLKYDTVQ